MLQRAVADTLLTGLLLATLTRRLFKFFRPAWLLKLAGLVSYALVLSPAFLRVAWFVAFSPHVRFNVRYGDNPRNLLDLYLPDKSAVPGRGTEIASVADGPAGGRPVIVFITGGMWIIGYKAWGALLGRDLMEQGCVVASLDYRNFPQGTVGDMLEDVRTGIKYVIEHCVEWGGDPTRISIVGQSAGAHLGALALTRQAEWEATRQPGVSPWPLSAVYSFVGISGVYTPEDKALIEHMNEKGLYKEVFWSIMEAGLTGSRGDEALARASPVQAVKGAAFRRSGAAALLPPIHLVHGDADVSALPSQSTAFAAALREAGATVACERYYPGKTHTSPFIEDPISGGEDALLRDVVRAVHGADFELPARPALLPRVLVRIAELSIPF